MAFTGVLVWAADWDAGFSEKSSNGMSLSWKLDKEFIYVKVSAPTAGWIAVGFGATTGMKDADIIIGYVSGNTVVLEDHFGNAVFAHKPDKDLGGKDSILEKGGSFTNGVTELRFKLALDSKDKYDEVFKPGAAANIILAYRNDTKLASKHTAKTKFQITY